ELQVELCERWGYALELGEANAGTLKQLDDPESLASRLLALTVRDSNRYPLSVLTHRPFYSKDFTDPCPPETWSVDPKTGKKVWSPAAPDSVFARGAKITADALGRLRKKAPVAIVLNGGEYALSVYGHHGKAWEQDARVVAAKGKRSWFEYVSTQKARQEAIVSNACRRAVPDRLLYIYYFADGCSHRNAYKGWDVWAWDYRHMRAVTDLPSSSVYYRHFNSGWTGKSDMLTQALNGVGRHIGFGENESYNWMNAGWTRKDLGDEAFGDIDIYLGYLKCCYTAGMIGGVAGYFAYPKGGFGAKDVGSEPPRWLRQMVALARVHALFSHLEEHIRSGDLLPGPDRHRWSKDQPAYEFPTGDATARVLARRHRRRDEWLITAWAAGGEDRDVAVTSPELGRVKVSARATGSVYRAVLSRGKPSLTLVDVDGRRPAASPAR
ncbi:MAG: hypothetical protein WBF17_14080, partial [Phycisphaerae bacterium]